MLLFYDSLLTEQYNNAVHVFIYCYPLQMAINNGRNM